MKRWVQRPVLDLQYIIGAALNVFGDLMSVRGAQQIERATTNFACSIVRRTELMLWPGYRTLTPISPLSEVTLSPPNSTLSALTAYSEVISG